MIGERKGPGHTKYIVNADGGVDCQRWNDPSWRTTLMAAHDVGRPDRVASMLDRAYRAGYADRGEVVRRAIGADAVDLL